MPFFKVKVKKLNRRKSPTGDLNEKLTVVGFVREGFQFESRNVIENSTGKWVGDINGSYYWAEGLQEIAALEPAAPPRPAAPSPVAPPRPVAVGLGRDWWFDDYKVEELWKRSRGEGVTVAVLDSGLASGLSEFEGRNIRYFNALTNTSDAESCNDNDTNTNGHGTDGVAILCGKGSRLIGVAPEIDLLVIKVTDKDGSRPEQAILTGLQKAIAEKVDIISMSLFVNAAEPMRSLIQAEIKKAFDLNICVLASVGDNGDDDEFTENFPASMPECLSIGGLTRARSRSRFSQKSNFLDLMGPGEDILSVFRPTQKIRGTSFSAPFAAGNIAIVKSMARKSGIALNNLALFDLLKRSANSNFSGYNALEYGWGIIDTLNTIQLLQKLKPLQ